MQNGEETTVFDLSIWNKLDGSGQLAAFKQYEQVGAVYSGGCT